MRIRATSFGLLLLLLVIPVLAQAKPGKQVRDKENAARKACMIGNHLEGVSILADLYIEIGDPNYIFNQARCLQQNNRWQEALDRFREYLRKATSVKDRDRSEIEHYMRECEDHLAASMPAPKPATPSAPEPAPQVASPVAAPAISVDPTTEDAPAPAADNPGAGLRIAGIVTGAIGLAGIGTGVYCSVKTYSLRHNPSELRSYKKLGIISYAAGGVTLATGVILYIVGATRKGGVTSDGVAVSFFPTVERGSGFLRLQGSF